jgi:hypothetical protein
MTPYSGDYGPTPGLGVILEYSAQYLPVVLTIELGESLSPITKPGYHRPAYTQ